MKVQVTKDSGGVSIWYADVELTYAQLQVKHRDEIGTQQYMKDPVWITKKNYWLRLKRCKVMSNKFVAKYFPDLGRDLKVGDNRAMNLCLIVQ